MGEGVRIHPVSHIPSTQASTKASVSEDTVTQPVRNTDRGSWVALGQEAVFPLGLRGLSRDGGLGPVHVGTRGSPLPFWVSLMEGLRQMVRNIFLSAPPFSNENKQSLLTVDKQPSLSPEPRPQTHSAEKLAHGQVCSAARGRVVPMLPTCPKERGFSISNFTLEEKPVRPTTCTQKAWVQEGWRGSGGGR